MLEDYILSVDQLVQISLRYFIDSLNEKVCKDSTYIDQIGVVINKDCHFGFRLTLRTNMETAAVNILKRAVEMDEKRRYTEAMVCYQEGIQLLIDSIKSNFSSNATVYLVHLSTNGRFSETIS